MKAIATFLALFVALVVFEQAACLQADQCMRLSDCPTGDVCSAGLCVPAGPPGDGGVEGGDAAPVSEDAIASPGDVVSADAVSVDDGGTLEGQAADALVEAADDGG